MLKCNLRRQEETKMSVRPYLFVLVSLVATICFSAAYVAFAQNPGVGVGLSLNPLQQVVPNPLQVAILRWYNTNSAVQFNVGTFPMGVAFDGANIWVANFQGNTVTKLRAS